MTFEPGDKLCSCTLLVKCGEGSYGEVWLAENAIGGRVALKILKKKFSEREIRGLQNYKDCDHPNLLKIRHIEIGDDFVCYTMDAADDLNNGKGDYLPDTLANRLNKYGRLDGKEITAMLDGVLDGLEELHKHGLVHRDIKPDNILYINGRATLSDAGLIAPVGQNTLVGSPGFISPRLMESGGVAETSDDFYALSKVVFCALTGLAPAEYPTIPQEMTISVDPKINRAILAGCSQEIKSSAEFRKAVAGKVIPQPQKKTDTKRNFFIKLIICIAVIVPAIWIFQFFKGHVPDNQTVIVEPSAAPVVPSAVRQQPVGSAPAVVIDQTPENTEVPEKSLFEYPQLPDLNYEYYRGRKTTAADVFRHFELYQGKYLPELLNHRIFSARLVMSEISDIQTAYYNKPEAHQVSLLSLDLQHLRLTGKKEEELLKKRQRYWREQSGKPEDIIRRMLTEDPMMQMAAINMLLEKFCRHVVEIKEYENKYKQTVQQLIALQMELLGG